MPDNRIQFTVRAEGPKVFVLVDHRLAMELEPGLARELARAMLAKAGEAEAHIEAERIIRESALLMRTGAPFTLTDNARMLDEAAKVAATDRDLRRYIPSIKSTAVVGTPSITQEPRR